MLKNYFFENFKKNYLGIFIVCNLIASVIIYKTNNYIGDFKFYFREETNIFLKIFCLYFIYIFLFKNILDILYNKLRIKKKIKFEYKYLDYLVLILILIRLVLLMFFDYGKVTSDLKIPGGTILINLFPVEYFFYFFYSLRRKSKLLIGNSVLFFILQLLQGWTYFVFIIGVIEITIRKKNKIKIKEFCIIIILGIVLYSLLTPLKQKMRYSKEYVLEKDAVIESSKKLVGRLSTFSNYLFLEKNKEKITKIIKNKNEENYKYVLEYYSMILPKKKMKLENYETINHLLPNHFNHLEKNLKGKISYDITLIGRIILVYNSMNFLQTIIFISFISFNIVLTIFLTRLHRNNILNSVTYVFMWLLFFSGNIQSFFKYQYSLVVLTVVSILIYTFKVRMKKCD